MTKPKKFLINKILIPYDFSETAALSLEHAVFMAQLLKADITLLHIVETVSFTSAISHALGGFEKKIETATNEKLTQVADEIHRKSGIALNIRTEVGRIYRKINAVAKEMKIDMIVMGTHGVSGYQKFQLGTNTSKVVSDAPCPVLSVQTHRKNLGFKKIILPIDDSPASRQKVNYALELAQHYGSHVNIAGLINFTNEDLKRKFKIKVEQVEEYLLQHGIGCDVSYMTGDNLAQMTLKHSEEQDADLIVIMTEQEPSLTGLFMGTYATQVVNHSKIPVLSVHPMETDPDKISVSY
ncbi:MAG TPA: universal stress protein [Bacteroidia bacterium]|nr:universal stress protein [Bacteroidia bacterium]